MMARQQKHTERSGLERQGKKKGNSDKKYNADEEFNQYTLKLLHLGYTILHLTNNILCQLIYRSTESDIVASLVQQSIQTNELKNGSVDPRPNSIDVSNNLTGYCDLKGLSKTLNLTTR